MHFLVSPNRREWLRLKSRLAPLALCGLLSGCTTPSSWHESAGWTPDYHPKNVFLYTPVLPYDLKRVAVLPLTCDARRSDLQDGCGSLSPILLSELIKTRKFEVVPVSCEVLQSRTGHPAWTGVEILPASFFDSLREVYGCDGVLFCQLTVFHAYAPLAVGWRMRLVDARTRQTLWAADEVLDAPRRAPSMDDGYRLLSEPFMNEDSGSEWPMLNSPREFGQYAAAQILATLPDR